MMEIDLTRWCASIVIGLGAILVSPSYAAVYHWGEATGSTWGTGGLTGAFSDLVGLPSGYAVNYNYQSGNQVALVPLPAPSSIGTWRMANFGTATATGIAADTADPDGDGRSNLLEYAFGTNPNLGDSASAGLGGETVSYLGVNYLGITFPRRKNSDIQYLVEISPDLVNWTAPAIQSGVPVDLNDTFELVTFRDSVPISNASRRFMRLRISLLVNPPATGAPNVLYTDILSGPTTGGENNMGTYLSIFGQNFGTTGLGSTVRVYINNVEVGHYCSIGVCKARPDVQQITVQVGGSPTPGTAYPIKVVVNGVDSNADHKFTPNPGRMLFVSGTGNDATAVPGDKNHPYRHVGQASTGLGAWVTAQPGDTIVMLASGTTAWSDIAYGDYYFLRFNKNGTAPTGVVGTGPFTLMAYPGDNVLISLPPSTSATGALTGVDSSVYPGGRWVTIAGLRIEAGGRSGPIALQQKGDQWRIVNNELTAATGISIAKAAGIAGNGSNCYFYGNHIHAIYGSPVAGEEHGIYLDGSGSYDIAHNVIEDVQSGSGFQTYADGGNGWTFCSNVSFHHNLIHGTKKFGINLGLNTQDNIQVYNNVVYDITLAGLRFDAAYLNAAKIYNNTFAATNKDLTQNGAGVIENDSTFLISGTVGALDMENNIFIPSDSSIRYSGGGDSIGGPVGGNYGKVAHNLYFGGSNITSFDSAPVLGDPAFVTPGSNYHLKLGSKAKDVGSSSVSSLVTTDYDILARPQGAGFDIGAYEYTTVTTGSDVTAGLMARYKFESNVLDTSTGDSIADDATAFGSPAYSGSGAPVGANSIILNGTTQYATVANSTEVNLTTASTIAVWVKIASSTDNSYRMIVSKKSTYADPAGYEFFYHPVLNRLYFRSGGTTPTYSFELANLDLDTGWHHLAVTVNGSTGNFYVDGVLQNVNVSGTVANPLTSTQPLAIGRRSGTTEYPWNGQLDDLRLYNRDLSAAEIQTVYVQTQ